MREAERPACRPLWAFELEARRVRLKSAFKGTITNKTHFRKNKFRKKKKNAFEVELKGESDERQESIFHAHFKWSYEYIRTLSGSLSAQINSRGGLCGTYLHASSVLREEVSEKLKR